MKHKLLLLTCCILIFLTGNAQNLLIKGGHIVDATSNQVVENKGILIIAGKIYDIGAIEPESDVQTLQLTANDYLLPGLFDLHAHMKVVYQGISKEDTVTIPKLYLANGVTSIFTCGEVDPEAVLTYKNNVARGVSIGPRILNSGPYFGDKWPNWSDDFTEQDIYDLVDEWAAKGVSGFKARDISEKHLKPLIERAHAHGLTVTGHISHIKFPNVGSDVAIPLGIDRLEHFIGGVALPENQPAYGSVGTLDINDPKIDEAIRLFVDHQVYFNPTLASYGGMFTQSSDRPLEFWVDEKKYYSEYTQSIMDGNPKRYDERRDNFYEISKKILKKYYDKGGLISLGTDEPLTLDFLWDYYTAGFNTHREIELFYEIGIPAHKAIQIGTINSARAMGISDKFGTIEVGKFADLFIIKGNPLENIYNTRSVHTVIKNGMIYDTQTLLKSCEGKLGPESKEKWFGE